MPDSGLHVMHGNRVRTVEVRHTSNQCELVGHLRCARNVFTNLRTRDTGRDRIEWPPYFRSRSRLEIPDILVRRCAKQKTKDTGGHYNRVGVFAGMMSVPPPTPELPRVNLYHQ